VAVVAVNFLAMLEFSLADQAVAVMVDQALE
jgi:hypothetical protein